MFVVALLASTVAAFRAVAGAGADTVSICRVDLRIKLIVSSVLIDISVSSPYYLSAPIDISVSS